MPAVSELVTIQVQKWLPTTSSFRISFFYFFSNLLVGEKGI
jgi:hypothetical protein